MATEPIKYSDLFPDDGGLDKLIKKIAELDKVYDNLTKKIEGKFQKLKKETEGLNLANENDLELLKKREKELDKLNKGFDDLQVAEDDLIKTKKQALKLSKEEQRLIEKRNSLTTEAAQSNAELKVEISELNKELKQQARESKGLVGEYEKQSRKLNDLRKQYKNLAAAGKENSEEAQRLLVDVQNLDKRLKDIDASVGQFQRNVGNYGEAMREAAEATANLADSTVSAIDSNGILGEIMGKLQIIVGLLSKAKDKLTAETNENTVAEKVNEKATKKATITQRIFGKSIKGSTKAFKAFNTALKASVIGLIIVALGSLASFLTKTQAGLDKVRASSLASNAIIGELSARLIALGPALLGLAKTALIFPRILINGINTLIKGYSALGTVISNAFDFSDEAKAENEEAKKAFKETASDFGKVFTDVPQDVANAFNGITNAVDGLGGAIDGIIEKAEPLAKELSRLELENAKLSKTVAEQLAISEKLEEVEGDNTRSFEERKTAIEGSIEAQKKAADDQLKIALNTQKIFEDELAFRLQSGKLTNDDKIARIEVEKEVLEARKEASLKGLALLRVANQLEQDLIEKNLDIIIDGFDNQKTINEQIIADEEENFKKRLKLLDDTKDLRVKALKDEQSELQRLSDVQFKRRQEEALKEGKVIAEASRPIIKINELIAITDSKRLNEKIRGLELSEIGETRLLEVVKENRTAIRDLKVAEDELSASRLEFLEASIQATQDLSAENEKSAIKQAEIQEQFRFERQLKDIEARIELAKDDIKLTKQLEAEKTEIIERNNQIRKQQRVDAFVEANDIEFKELEITLIKQGKTQKEIQEALRDERINDLTDEIKTRQENEVDALDQRLELARLAAEKEKEIEEEKFKNLSEIRDQFILGALDGFDKVLDKRLETNQKEQDATKEQITKQQQLAQDGLTNTLAFEEAELAKAEQKKIQLEKQRIRLEEIKALYSAYSAAASSGDTDAITTALRDFAILRATSAVIQSAFGEGTGEHGTVSESLDARRNGAKGGNSLMGGIFKGESHAKRGKGIPVLVEGGEGILSTKQMNTLGKGNFMSLTKALNEGAVGRDFFSSQTGQIPSFSSYVVDNTGLKQELKEVKDAINNKPVPSLHAESISDTITDLVHTVNSGNKTVKSRYRINKSRL